MRFNSGPDGHDDFAIVNRFFFGNKLYTSNFTQAFEQGGFPIHVDLPRLKKGQVGGTFWVAYAPCPREEENWNSELYSNSEFGPPLTA